MALTNDYVSWNNEKYQSTDRIRSTIPLLMRQYALQEPQARSLLKGMIMDEKEKPKRMRMKLERKWRNEMSGDMKRYIETLVEDTFVRNW